MFFISLFFWSLLNHQIVSSRDTGCAESSKLFADLCFSPKPLEEFDAEWLASNQPADGWHVELGNDIVRLHHSELLKGKLLDTIDDDIKNNMCLRVKLENGGANGYHDGELFGFENSYTNLTCIGSKDFPGVDKCKLNSGISEYHEDLDLYFSYFDKKNVHINVLCFPNGQVGWLTISKTNKLTDEEKEAVNQHIISLGFSTDTTVEMYNNINCNKK